ncbi:permease [Mycoplasmatota bacterium]|nr:permease [Mycoplasmatota bacterium]
MGISSYILYVLTAVLLVISFIKDKKKTKKALKKGYMAFIKILPVLIPLFLFVGIILTLITPDQIRQAIGEDSGVIGVIISLVVGSVSFMPPFVTYPLGAELLENGAGYPQVAALVTTLMAVGFVYIGAETKFFSKRATLLRNSLALIGSIVVAIVIWMVM